MITSTKRLNVTTGIILVLLGLAALLASVALVEASSQRNPFETGFVSGGTSTRLQNPDILGPKGFGKLTKSGAAVKDARIAFERIRGGLDYHQDAINRLVQSMAAKKNIKVVGIDENPTHIVRGRILSFKTGSGVIVSYRWKVLSPEGKKLQKFVDSERGTRVRVGAAWNGISRIELAKVSETSAARLVYWLNAGAK